MAYRQIPLDESNCYIKWGDENDGRTVDFDVAKSFGLSSVGTIRKIIHRHCGQREFSDEQLSYLRQKEPDLFLGYRLTQIQINWVKKVIEADPGRWLSPGDLGCPASGVVNKLVQITAAQDAWLRAEAKKRGSSAVGVLRELIDAARGVTT